MHISRVAQWRCLNSRLLTNAKKATVSVLYWYTNFLSSIELRISEQRFFPKGKKLLLYVRLLFVPQYDYCIARQQATPNMPSLKLRYISPKHYQRLSHRVYLAHRVAVLCVIRTGWSLAHRGKRTDWPETSYVGPDLLIYLCFACQLWRLWGSHKFVIRSSFAKRCFFFVKQHWEMPLKPSIQTLTYSTAMR